MTKFEFSFQYYYRRWICAFPCLLIALLLNTILIKYIHQKYLFFILCALIMVAFMKLYYYCTKKFGWFKGSGAYWTEGDVIYVQTGKKILKIDSVKEVLGDVVDVYSNRCASIMIDTGKQKYKIFSEQLDDTQEFSDASIYLLYQLIVSKFDLKLVEIMGQKTEYWHKKL